MVRILQSFRPDGTRRAVWSPAVAESFRAAGEIPHRASNVEVVEEGPDRGRFYADFTKLAELENDPSLCICLASTFASHAEAVAAEVRWLEQHWVLAPCRERTQSN